MRALHDNGKPCFMSHDMQLKRKQCFFPQLPLQINGSFKKLGQGLEIKDTIMALISAHAVCWQQGLEKHSMCGLSLTRESSGFMSHDLQLKRKHCASSSNYNSRSMVHSKIGTRGLAKVDTIVALIYNSAQYASPHSTFDRVLGSKSDCGLL